MKIIIELDSPTSQQPEIIKKETSAVPEQGSTNLATFVSASPIDAGAARIPEGSGMSSDGNPTAVQSNQSSMPFSLTGALDAGAAKIQGELMPMAMHEISPTGSFEQGNAFSAGSMVNMGTHHN
jgi:hypothetical protein